MIPKRWLYELEAQSRYSNVNKGLDLNTTFFLQHIIKIYLKRQALLNQHIGRKIFTLLFI